MGQKVNELLLFFNLPENIVDKQVGVRLKIRVKPLFVTVKRCEATTNGDALVLFLRDDSILRGKKAHAICCVKTSKLIHRSFIAINQAKSTDSDSCYDIDTLHIGGVEILLPELEITP